MNQRDQLLIIYLTLPASDFYITKLIRKSENPVLEPFTLSDLNAGTISIFGQNIGVVLKNISVAGLSNIQVAKTGNKPQITENPDGSITFVAVRPNTEAPPAGVPTDLTINTTIYLDAQGVPSPPIPAVVTVHSATLTGTFRSSGDVTVPSSVTVRFTSLVLKAPTGSENVGITLNVDSVFKPQVMQLLQQPSTQQDILNEINNKLNAADVLNAVSNAATQGAQNALKNMPGVG